MKKFGNLIIISLVVSFVSFNVVFGEGYDTSVIPLESSSTVIHADVKSERVPMGTLLEVRMETPVNTHNYFEGDTFRANLLEDIRIGNLIVLPSGTMVRGSVDFVKPARRFSRGGELSLKFDHAVTPFGKQIPLVAKVSRAKKLNPDGVFVTGGSYLKTLGETFDTSANIMTTTTEYCVNKGLSFWKGLPVMITAPTGVCVGTIGGSSYFIGKSVYSMFKKGDNVKVNPGDVIEVTLTEPLDVPIN